MNYKFLLLICFDFQKDPDSSNIIKWILQPFRQFRCYPFTTIIQISTKTAVSPHIAAFIEIKISVGLKATRDKKLCNMNAHVSLIATRSKYFAIQ